MSSGSFGCNPHDRSATRWAVYGVSVQHNIQHAQVQSSKSSCVPVKGYTVLKREQWACFKLLWDSKQRFSMCDELESKLLNSLNSPDLCLFRLLLIFHLTNKSASAWKLHGASLCQSKVRTWSSCHWASENRLTAHDDRRLLLCCWVFLPAEQETLPWHEMNLII